MKNNLKLIRITRNLSQDQLSLLTGIDQPLISKFERGYKKPSPDQVKSLSVALRYPERKLRNLLKV